MTYRIYILSISILFAFKSYSLPATEPLIKFIAKMEGMPSFEYTSYMNIHQEGLSFADTTEVYIERNEGGRLLPLKFVLESTRGDFQFFDGSGFFNIVASERTILKMENPPPDQVLFNQGLIFSPIYLRNLTKYLLENDPQKIKFLKDTMWNENQTALYEIDMNYIYLLNGNVVRNGDIQPNQMTAQNIRKRYIIGLDKKTNLPNFMKEYFPNQDYFMINFSSFRSTQKTYSDRAEILRSEKFLTLNIEEYMRIQMAKQIEIIGQYAQPFSLPLYPEKVVNLSDFTGKPVLLEFWFPGCGFCMSAVPEVNQISKTFREKGLEVLGIEFSNASLDRISKYIDDQKVDIPVLMQGKELSLQYSVNSGPTFILLDKNHKIVYRSSGLDREKIIEEINKVF